jgi:hypothetical protein
MSDGKKRIQELNELMHRSKRLSTEEYIDLLLEVRDKNIVELAILANQRIQKGTGSIINILEKVHYLVDSAGGSNKADNDKTTYHVEFAGWDGKPEESKVCA